MVSVLRLTRRNPAPACSRRWRRARSPADADQPLSRLKIFRRGNAGHHAASSLTLQYSRKALPRAGLTAMLRSRRSR
ncbi:hypothetical protein KCP70_06355 [Salmonella enterica subsp. enterica]|nr:hypothetical protein KCP70_06355 [Salmonella enterica subsp. enterica]